MDKIFFIIFACSGQNSITVRIKRWSACKTEGITKVKDLLEAKMAARYLLSHSDEGHFIKLEVI